MLVVEAGAPAAPRFFVTSLTVMVARPWGRGGAADRQVGPHLDGDDGNVVALFVR
jgi:hypothetical protein